MRADVLIEQYSASDLEWAKLLEAENAFIMGPLRPDRGYPEFWLNWDRTGPTSGAWRKHRTLIDADICIVDSWDHPIVIIGYYSDPTDVGFRRERWSLRPLGNPT